MSAQFTPTHFTQIIPVGRWVDPEARFLPGSVLTVFADAHGCVTLAGKMVPLKVRPTQKCKKSIFQQEIVVLESSGANHYESKLQSKKMSFVMKDNNIDNEFVQVGDTLHGKFITEADEMKGFKLVKLDQVNADALAQVKYTSLAGVYLAHSLEQLRERTH